MLTNLSDDSELAKKQVWVITTESFSCEQNSVLFIKEELSRVK